jgi:hypothetical protein
LAEPFGYNPARRRIGVQTEQLAAEWVGVADLREWEGNPRQEQPVEEVAESIRRFGFGAPILARPNGEIIAGHTRWKAAQSIGLDRVPVRYMDLTENEARALALADNRLGELAAWDVEGLADALREIRGESASLDALGWQSEDLDLLFDLYPEPGAQESPEEGSEQGSEPEVSPEVEEQRESLSLAEKFVVPPFSILDARQGYWQSRKREWLALGIASELGRGQVNENMVHPATTGTPNFYQHKRKLEEEMGRDLSTEEARDILMERGLVDDPRQRSKRANAMPGGSPRPLDRMRAAKMKEKARANAIPGGSRLPATRRAEDGSIQRGDSRGNPALRREADKSTNLTGAARLPEWASNGTEYIAPGTSIFDPVLCEIAYRWFAPEGGSVLDPFAGGSVRGVVASVLGHAYTGIELRAEQVEANRVQGEEIVPDMPPRWICGDSRNIPDLLAEDERFDLVFSCPPYADLEVYSDDPLDLSVIAADEGYPAFRDLYMEILRLSFERLRENRFAVIVVGDVRAKDGGYVGFVEDTIRAGRECGLALYNHAILVTAFASLALRVGRAFGGWRKLGKTHQDVIVLYKGDLSAIKDEFGEAQFAIDPKGALAKLSKAEPQESPEEPQESPESPEEPEIQAEPETSPEEPQGLREEPSASDAPKWAKGYPLDELRALRSLFREHDGDLPLGAFSAAKENAIADWLDNGKLDVIRNEEGEPVAAVLVSTSKSKRRIADFAGRPLGTVNAGVPFVQRVAWRGEEGLVACAQKIRALSRSGEIWWQLWQESEEERALAERLGFVWTGSKIKASSEVIGVWRKTRMPAFALGEDLPEHDRAHLSPLALPAMPEECEALRVAIEERVEGWADHYSSYNLRKSWTALALAGFGGDPEFIVKPSEMSRKWKAENPEALGWEVADTTLRELLPEAEPLIAAVPGRKERIRIMRLAADTGELARHSDITDPDCGTAEGKLLRIHWPIQTSPEVMFDGWLDDGARVHRHMEQGRAWYLDTRKPHRAVNKGERDRIHLVLDVYSCPELLALLRRGE